MTEEQARLWAELIWFLPDSGAEAVPGEDHGHPGQWVIEAGDDGHDCAHLLATPQEVTEYIHDHYRAPVVDER